MYFLQPVMSEAPKEPRHSGNPFDIRDIVAGISSHMGILDVGVDHVIAISPIDQIRTSSTGQSIATFIAAKQIVTISP